MQKADIGIYGMGVMGSNLALNIENKGYIVSVYNITPEETRVFAKGPAQGKKFFISYDIKSFITGLKPPRKILLMVTAGNPVDGCIQELLPLLDKGDLIIDGGNSFFKDTIRRNTFLTKKGIFFIGTGVSGGEEGALKGPAIMPGGQREAYKLVEKIFIDISAKAYDGAPCVAYIGPDGAGHFVKMVHNGIEYGDMEMIGECAWVFRDALGMNSGEVADIMAEWNGKDDILRSYLIEITADSMKEKHKPTDTPSPLPLPPGERIKGEGQGEFLVDRVADITRMKGTGTWTIQSALELLVPVPSIAAAVFSREMSQDKDLRLKMSQVLTLPVRENSDDIGEAGALSKALERGVHPLPREEVIKLGHDALYIAKIASYAQGMALLQAASREYKFNLNLGEIAKIWRAGCIIRAQFLNEITKAYKDNPELPNLLADPKFSDFVCQNLTKLARFISIAHGAGLPVMALTSAYDYIAQLASPALFSAQVAALQRDYFGAHGYFKIGGPEDPTLVVNGEGKVREFHTEWLLEGRPEKEITK